jgi:hypothetical protein
MVFNSFGPLPSTGVVFLLATTVAKVSCSVQPLVINPSETWYATSMMHMQHFTDGF